MVVSREFESGSTVHVELRSGQSLDIPKNRSVRPLSGGTPYVGDLLFYGDAPEPWFVAIHPAGAEFEESSQVDDASDGSITLDSGLRLPLASTYREIRGPMEPDAPVRYAINAKGEVTERR